MRRVIAALAKRPYANRVHCHTSHDCFVIGTAPSYAAQQASPASYRRILCICPVGQGFRVGYGATSESTWGWHEVEGNIEEVGCWVTCNPEEVITIADQVIPRHVMAEGGEEQDR